MSLGMLIIVLGASMTGQREDKGDIMKIGVNLKIDVTKLDKSRFYVGAKGTYADLTAFIDLENTSQYGDHGMITQSKNKDEDVQMAILGNAKIFWRDDNASQKQEQPAPEKHEAFGSGVPDDNIPF